LRNPQAACYDFPRTRGPEGPAPRKEPQMRKVTSHTVQVARRAKIGQKAEAVTETWAERQARVNAEREARRKAREAEANGES
jgi:hypothetical protein